MNKNVTFSREQIAAFCQNHGIRRLAMFGSALRDDFRPDSDVDVLVEFAPDRIPTCCKWPAWNASYRKSSAGERWICAHPRISAAISGNKSSRKLRCTMRKDDAVRLRHMLDAAREATGFV